jgi:hypothetical protein
MNTRFSRYTSTITRAAAVTLALALSAGHAWGQAGGKVVAIDPDDPKEVFEDVGPKDLKPDLPQAAKEKHKHKTKPAKGRAPVEPERFATRPQQEIRVLALESDKKEKKLKK